MNISVASTIKKQWGWGWGQGERNPQFTPLYKRAEPCSGDLFGEKGRQEDVERGHVSYRGVTEERTVPLSPCATLCVLIPGENAQHHS